MRSDLPGWDWVPATYEAHPEREGVLLSEPGSSELIFDAWPALTVFTGSPILHVRGWRCMPGGDFGQPPHQEDGLRRGFASTDLDDSDWYATSRVNEVTFCFPTWEGDSYEGYLWYRAKVAVGDDRPNRLMLGSPAERRSLSWRAYINGVEVTVGSVDAAVLDVPIPETARPAAGTTAVVAVQLRIQPPVLPDERSREREGWRRVDLNCLQLLCVDEPWQRLLLTRVQHENDLISLTGPNATVDIRYSVAGGIIRKSVEMRNSGDRVVTIATADLAAVATDRLVSYHPEGAWATFGSRFLCVAHPAGCTLPDVGGPTARIWPGLELRPGQVHAFPDVLLGSSDTGDGVDMIHQILTHVGRDRQPRAIYDPYGWYQISHASEPKTELDSSLVGEMDRALSAAAEGGLRFDLLALDCGWNDPDDLRRFHPRNFPNGPADVLDLASRHGLDLMLWVSPSDGPRAFRHELGLKTPGFDACLADSGLFPWRLCPAAEPWASTFRDALVHHAQVHGARGFKIDGAELWCASEQHGHLPGLWSGYATTRALCSAFRAATDAGADFLMLYWGLRSPWWLRYGSTLYEGDYLVEAAAPSGQQSWGLRSAVCSSQDIGHQSSWTTVPAHQQDSLGVWVSDTAWASWQGRADWADAVIMDAARGSLLTQVWGDIRMLPWDAAAQDVWRCAREAQELIRTARGQLVAGRPWKDQVYGYLWEDGHMALVVLSNSGEASETVIDLASVFPAADGVVCARIGYRSAGRDATAALDAGAKLTIAQDGGSVVAVFVSRKAGPPSPAWPRPAAALRGWRQIVAARRPLRPHHDGFEMAAVASGRVSGQPFMTGPVELAEALAKLPPRDRDLVETRQVWQGTVDVAQEREAGLFVALDRDGAAWHNDRLHELVRVEVSLDGAAVPLDLLPYRMHEQAGSWSWVVARFPVPSGEHRLVAAVVTATPASVSTTVGLRLR